MNWLEADSSGSSNATLVHDPQQFWANELSINHGAPSGNRRIKIDRGDLNDLFTLRERGLGYLLAGNDFRVVTHPVTTTTGAEKAELLGVPESRVIVTRIYWNKTDRKLYGVVTPSDGMINLHALTNAELVENARKRFSDADPNDLEALGMAVGTCNPFISEHNPGLAGIFFDLPRVQESRRNEEICDFGFTGGAAYPFPDSQTSLGISYAEAYRLLKQTFPAEVHAVPALRVDSKDEIVKLPVTTVQRAIPKHVKRGRMEREFVEAARTVGRLSDKKNTASLETAIVRVLSDKLDAEIHKKNAAELRFVLESDAAGYPVGDLETASVVSGMVRLDRFPPNMRIYIFPNTLVRPHGRKSEPRLYRQNGDQFPPLFRDEIAFVAEQVGGNKKSGEGLAALLRVKRLRAAAAPEALPLSTQNSLSVELRVDSSELRGIGIGSVKSVSIKPDGITIDRGKNGKESFRARSDRSGFKEC